jgi:catechol 2,3-dioxygenase-like lactoylglutathione lyase family enzyme
VKDLVQTSEFYKKLGFEIISSDDTIRIKLGDFTLEFMDEAKVRIDKEAGMKPKGLGVFTYVEVDNVDEQYEFVVGNNVKPSSEPTSFPWGRREFAVKDPDGFKIIFYQQLGNRNE